MQEMATVIRSVKRGLFLNYHSLEPLRKGESGRRRGYVCFSVLDLSSILIESQGR